jgi:hypothetical protein
LACNSANSQLPSLLNYLRLTSQETPSVILSAKSQSHIATDGQSVSQSVSLGVEPQMIFITVWQLQSCFCGAPSLTRRRVCLLYMLLVLASAVLFGSESRGTRDHILLSQIRDFPFRRLLRLAGSRWRYSTPPPHTPHGLFLRFLLCSLWADPTENNFLAISILFAYSLPRDRVYPAIA